MFFTVINLYGRVIYKCTPGMLKFRGSDKLSSYALLQTSLYFFDAFVNLCQKISLRRRVPYKFFQRTSRRRNASYRRLKKRLGKSFRKHSRKFKFWKKKGIFF